MRDDDERWTQAASMRWDALPARVAGAIAERIARLEPATREALRAASVEGDVFTVEVVARVVERDPRAVVREVAGALDRHELVAGIDVRRAPRGLVSRYRFRHELIQRFLYDQLDESERAYLHEAVAEALKAVLGDEADPGALAFHYLQAHAPQRAAPHLRSAGDRARRSAALAEAVDFYTRALSAWPEQDATGRATRCATWASANGSGAGSSGRRTSSARRAPPSTRWGITPLRARCSSRWDACTTSSGTSSARSRTAWKRSPSSTARPRREPR